MKSLASLHYLKVLRANNKAEAVHQVALAKAAAVAKGGSSVLSSDEKTRLLWRYVPDEAGALNTLRKESHKWLWRYVKKRDFSRFDACMEQLRDRQLPFDEITYNFAVFGILMHPKKDGELARQVMAEMVEERRFHPALLRLLGGFVESYFELKEVDAAPNRDDLEKLARTMWQISVNFKRGRIKETRRRLAEAASLHREQLTDEHGASVPALPEYDSDGEMSDGESKRRVKFPAKRPRALRNVYRGSGVPNRKKHRWKH